MPPKNQFALTNQDLFDMFGAVMTAFGAALPQVVIDHLSAELTGMANTMREEGRRELANATTALAGTLYTAARQDRGQH